MRKRHQIPSLFNLSMVDVLCCALGCVVLLWLLNLRDAKDRAHQAGESDTLLALARQEADLLSSNLSTAQGELTRLRRDLQSRRDQLTEAEKRLDTAQEQGRTTAAARDALSRQVQLLLSQKKDAENRYAGKVKDYGDLEQGLLQANQRVAALEGQVETGMRRAQALTQRLADADGRLEKLQMQADFVPGLRAELRGMREKYEAEQALALALRKELDEKGKLLASRGRQLQSAKENSQQLEQGLDERDKSLADANKRITSLANDNAALRNEAARTRAAADSRFAGIGLTGRRVIFLVDTSGSMVNLNKDKPAPGKWAGVCQTAAQVLSSLPDVEKFQVITFAERAAFLFPQQQDWIDFEGKASADRLRKAMLALTPEGGTNMYAALEIAFRFRAHGLDTIYLFSDGLPNMGEGIPLELASKITDAERGERLGGFIRQKLRAEWNQPLPNRPAVRINALGFFYESPEVGSFLWALAREHDGSFVGMSKP